MRYDAEKAAIVMSVGELCERANLPIHLDTRPGGAKRSAERAAIGREAHKRIQKNTDKGYESEVSLSNTAMVEGICYEVNGRADGIRREGDRVIVEEIKSVGARAFEGIPNAIHEAQGMCYAHFLACRDGLERVDVMLTLCRSEDGKVKSFQRTCEAEELRAFYLGLLEQVKDRGALLRERELERLPTAKAAKFPYSTVREGQDILMREFYRCIRRGRRLVAEAPTGTGKTISTLYPAVRGLGAGHCDKIFYLTAKASVRREAYAAAADLFEAGARLRTIVLTSREQMCANACAKADPAGISRHCNPEDCPRARGFYQKCKAAIRELTESQNGFPRSSLEKAAERFEICPYELQLELSELCDILICDYNYVFDPMVYLRRYFEGEAREKYVFLVDEAHNLVDRACDMFTADLKLSEVASVYRRLVGNGDAEDPAERFMPLEKLTVALSGCKRLCRDNLFADDNGVEHGYYLNTQQMLLLDQAVEECLALLEKWCFTHRGSDEESAVLRLTDMLKRYRTVAEAYDSHFITFVEVEGEEITLRLICRDPSRLLDAAMGRAVSTVLFSATLTPTDYFADLLGAGREAVKLSVPSPFDPKNVCLVAATGVSTRFEDREKSVKRLAGLIAATVSGKAGNYIFYFPSYDYMDRVYDAFTERYPKLLTVRQERGMSQRGRDAFLEAFADDGRRRVGFCVLGGSFSEGVDLPGGRLIGVGIIGVGLPGISNQRNLLKEYYDDTRESGYDYAYTYPGMNRVLQAAGRVIRRESDVGVIVLMDDRYAEDRYKALFPDHWLEMQYAGNASELANIVSDFWVQRK